MDILLYLVVLLLTFLGGWLAGLFGVSGAVVTVPFLLYGPQILGIPPIDIKQVMADSSWGVLPHKCKINPKMLKIFQNKTKLFLKRHPQI